MGRLTDDFQKPIPEGEVQVLEDSVVEGRRLVAVVATDAQGRFEYRLRHGTSRRVTVRYKGDETRLPAEASTRLLVRSRVKLSVRARRKRTEIVIRFRGRVLAAGADYSLFGKAVEIEYRTGGRWALFPVRIITHDGRFSSDYRMRRLARRRAPLRFRFRATVPVGDGWPYERGTSRSTTLTLR